MADEEKEKLTLGEAIKDLGWFPVLIAFVIGAPSILTILGGFVAAGLILAADFGLKALGVA
jgi:hypothetical protein